MRQMRDYLENDDAVMVISEARKPSGDGGKWGAALADIMGAARGGYAPDMVFLIGPFSDEELAEEFGLYEGSKMDEEAVEKKRDALQEEGLSLLKLKIAKGRDGVTRKEIPLTFRFRRSDFVEGTA